MAFKSMRLLFFFNVLVACHVRSCQHETAQYAIPKKEKLATIHSMRFCPYCLRSVLV